MGMDFMEDLVYNAAEIMNPGSSLCLLRVSKDASLSML